MPDKNERTEKAKELLRTVRNAAMATVNEDGTPHNTPFHFVIDESRQYMYLATSPEALHTHNLLRADRAFIVVYAPNEADGLYMEARHALECQDEDLAAGLTVWNAQRTKEGKSPIDEGLFTADSPQRMYRLELVRFWVNDSERNDHGNIIRDYRIAIERNDLL